MDLIVVPGVSSGEWETGSGAAVHSAGPLNNIIDHTLIITQ